MIPGVSRSRGFLSSKKTPFVSFEPRLPYRARPRPALSRPWKWANEFGNRPASGVPGAVRSASPDSFRTAPAPYRSGSTL
jgi:hypothetical protein